MNVSISICPTAMEVGGDRYDEGALLEAIREYVEARLGKQATITTLQIGHRQGDAWAKIDGDSEAGAALLADFFEDHGTDEELFVQPAKRWPTIRNCNFATRRDDLGRHVYDAIVAADRGTEDCDLVGALDGLEAVLASHAERDNAESERACTEAEEAVEAAMLVINAAFEKND